jgi:hypothetical protein
MRRYLPLAALLALSAAPAHAQTVYALASRTGGTPGYPATRVSPRMADITIRTMDGKLEMLLTGSTLTLQLTEPALQEAEREMDRDLAAEQGQGEFEDVISAAVRGTMHDALRRGYQYQLRDIRSMRYEDGRLVIVDRGGEELLAQVQTDGKPALASFAPEHAMQLVQEFNRLKR